jgi:hypothetical protein
MANTLVSPYDLEDFPGAPFSDTLVDAAVSDIRSEAGWHIAPQVTETLTLDSYGGQLLSLPSQRVVNVTAVRDMTRAGAVLTGWTRSSCLLWRSTYHTYCFGWPVGQVEVDIVHGFATTPPDLLAAVAARALRLSNPRDPSLASQLVGQVSQTYATSAAGFAPDPVVARYSLLVMA